MVLSSFPMASEKGGGFSPACWKGEAGRAVPAKRAGAVLCTPATSAKPGLMLPPALTFCRLGRSALPLWGEHGWLPVDGSVQAAVLPGAEGGAGGVRVSGLGAAPGHSAGQRHCQHQQRHGWVRVSS